MLEVKNITKYYGDFKAVDDLSFNVKKGEIFGLLGENGAGKTTTFRMIMNLMKPTSGSIKFNNEEINYDITDNIGFLTEERSLMTKMTVKEQLLYYGALKGMSEKQILKQIDILLNRFNIPNYKNRKINELSKGNQQKIQFISAILNEPKLLLLDEPFSGLDPINIELFKDVILDLKKKGTVIIFSSHQMETVEYFCEKLVILVKGKTVLSGELLKIKRDYMQKKIYIIGDVNKEELESISGVVKVTKTAKNYEVIIDSKDNAKNVFNYVKKKENILKYELSEISLNEIFIDKVGEAYGK